MAKSASAKTTVNSKYMVLKVYGGRRLFILLMLIAMSIGFGVLFERTFFNPNADSGLLVYGLIFATCLLMAFLPISEEWQYAPWQDGCRKCEKNIYS